MSIGPWDFGGFDIVVLLLLGISGLMSFSRGFMREIVSLVALVVGLAACLFLYGRFQGAANEMIQPGWLADGALIMGAFFIAYMIVTFVLRGGAKKLQGREVGFVDRLMGFGFGVARGLLTASLFIIIMGFVSKSDTAPDWIQDSTFYPVLRPIADTMLSVPFAQIKEEGEEIIERGRELDPEADPNTPDQSEPQL